jgi:hypothetical protein
VRFSRYKCEREGATREVPNCHVTVKQASDPK